MTIKRWIIAGTVNAVVAAILNFTVFKPEVITVRVAIVERGVVEGTVTNTAPERSRSTGRQALTSDRGLVLSPPDAPPTPISSMLCERST